VHLSRKRNLDPLGAEAPEDPLAQLVLDEKLIDKGGHLTDQGEIRE
jgi:hypothetical protein